MNSKKLNSELGRIDCSLRRFYVDRFMFESMNLVAAGSKVVDIGGHRDVKRGVFDIRDYDAHVTTVNTTHEKGADIIADAASMPLDANSFDCAVCCELLEHVEEPRKVLKEAFRVLRSGGLFLGTTPFMYQVHADPHDYARFTNFYWQRELSKIGFVDVEIKAQGAFWSVIVDSIREAFHQGNIAGKKLRWPIRSLVHRSILWGKKKAISWDSESISKRMTHLTKFTTGFEVIAYRR